MQLNTRLLGHISVLLNVSFVIVFFHYLIFLFTRRSNVTIVSRWSHVNKIYIVYCLLDWLISACTVWLRNLLCKTHPVLRLYLINVTNMTMTEWPTWFTFPVTRNHLTHWSIWSIIPFDLRTHLTYDPFNQLTHWWPNNLFDPPSHRYLCRTREREKLTFPRWFPDTWRARSPAEVWCWDLQASIAASGRITRSWVKGHIGHGSVGSSIAASGRVLWVKGHIGHGSVGSSIAASGRPISCRQRRQPSTTSV